MHKKVFKSLVIGFVLFLGVFFINYGSVAAGEKTENGYARCTYLGYIKSNSNQTKEYLISVLIYKPQGSSTNKATMTVKRSDNLHSSLNEASLASDYVELSPLMAEFKNESYGYEQSDADLETQIAKAFNASGKYSCPANIYTTTEGLTLFSKPSADTLDDGCKYNYKTDYPVRVDAMCDAFMELKLGDSSVSNEKGADLDGSKEGKTEDELKDELREEAKTDTFTKDNPDLKSVNDGWDIDVTSIIFDDHSQKAGNRNCSLIPESIIKFLKNLFLIIQVIGIILLVVLTIIEFIKVITTAEEDGLRGAIRNTFRRIIMAVLLLLLPLIIIFVLNIVNLNAYETKGGKLVIGEDGKPLCKVK